MSTKFDGYLIEYPGVMRHLAWPVDPPPEGPASVALVADVIQAFTPLVRPISLDVILRAYQREPYVEVPLSRPFLFAATSNAVSDVSLSPAYEGAICKQVDALTPHTIEMLVNEAALAEKLDPGNVWRWQDVRVYATHVRLPDVFGEHDVLSLEVPGGDIGVDVQHRHDGAWVSSTQAPSDSRPFELSMTGEFPKLDITTCWSLWMSGGPGEKDLDLVIEALIARGWVHCP